MDGMSAVTREDNLLQMTLRSDPRMLSEVRKSICDWSLQHHWTPDEAAEVVLAVDEALTNVIRHAYQCDSRHPIHLSLRAMQDPQAEGIEVRLRDFGRACDPALICGRPLEDVRPGGLGVHIIRAMMHSVEYSPAEGGGTLLVMRKYKTPEAARR
jgi:anti-sigma regulatory factor (Ser/Thr protein kinase)